MATVSHGCIFHWQEYKFSDGQTANKYFIILAAKNGFNFLAAIATSKPRGRKFEAGCHSKEGYYHIPGGGKDWFPRDTWVLLSDVVELTPSEFLKRAMEKQITLSGNLRADIANAIRNCFKSSPDASAHHISLL